MIWTNGATGRGAINIKRVITGDGSTNEIIGGTEAQGFIQSRDNEWNSKANSFMDSPNQKIGTTITYSLRIKLATTDVSYWLHEGGVAELRVQEIAT